MPSLERLSFYEKTAHGLCIDLIVRIKEDQKTRESHTITEAKVGAENQIENSRRKKRRGLIIKIKEKNSVKFRY